MNGEDGEINQTSATKNGHGEKIGKWVEERLEMANTMMIIFIREYWIDKGRRKNTITGMIGQHIITGRRKFIDVRVIQLRTIEHKTFRRNQNRLIKISCP